jgi:hypothetical protein
VTTTTGESIEGRTGEPFTMVVELGKVREFARATKSRHPAHDGAPGDRPISPTTFLMSSAFWTDDTSDPWQGLDRNLERLLHGEQEFEFHGEPPRAGDVLTGQARIDRTYTKRGKRGGEMRFTETVTEYRDAGGRLVAEVRGTSIETSRAATEARR